MTIFSSSASASFPIFVFPSDLSLVPAPVPGDGDESPSSIWRCLALRSSSGVVAVAVVFLVPVPKVEFWADVLLLNVILVWIAGRDCLFAAGVLDGESSERLG